MTGPSVKNVDPRPGPDGPNNRRRNLRICTDERFSDRPERLEQSADSPDVSGMLASGIRIPTSLSGNPIENLRVATFRIRRGANRFRT